MKHSIPRIIVCAAIWVLLLSIRLSLPRNTATWIVVECSYWILLLGTFWLVASLFATFRDRFCYSVWKKHRLGLVAALLATVFVQVHEPHRFKVLQDEYVMAGVSRSMHYSRQAFIGTHAHFLQGTLAVTSHLVEKRPLFFHFLQACLHDISGYRPGNVFVLNAALTFGVLALTYYFGQCFGGKSVGLLCLSLWAMLPLFAQASTSGGYDILNVFMIGLLWFCCKNYLERGGETAQAAMAFVAVHLAQVRSESILFASVPVVVILFRWRKTGEFELGWPTVFAQLFLFLPLLTNLIFASTPEFTQTVAGQRFFSLSYLPDNAGRALVYLFDVDLGRTNNAFVSVVGVVGIVLMAVRFGARVSGLATDGQRLLVLTLGLIVMANFGLILCQFWGQLDDPVASRFAFPLFGVMIGCVALSLGEFLRGRSLPVWVGAIVAAMFAYSASASTFAVATNASIWQSREMSWFLDEAQKPEHKGALLVAQPIAPIVYNFPALSLSEAEAGKWKIKECLRQKLYPEILVLERWTRSWDDFSEEPYGERRLYDLKKEVDVGDNVTALDSGFRKELVAELRLRPNVVSRISRIVSVEGKNTELPETVRKLGPPFRTAKDYDWYIYTILP